MIHNRLKFTSLLLVPSWLRGRDLDWRLSQSGFDPSYGKLVCLATLMSSNRTKQVCLWMTIYIYSLFVNCLWYKGFSEQIYRSFHKRYYNRKVVWVTFTLYLKENWNEISKGFQEGLMAARIKSTFMLQVSKEEIYIELRKNHSS